MTSAGRLAGPECFLCSWQLPALRGKMPVSDPLGWRGKKYGACQGMEMPVSPQCFSWLAFWSASPSFWQLGFPS